MKISEEKKETCPNKAVAYFPWGGKIIKCCNVHLRGLNAINMVIGGVSEPRRIEGSYKCEMPNNLDMYE